MPYNFTPPNGPPRPFRSQLLTPSQPQDKISLPQHPKWLPFVRLMHNLLHRVAPELRPQFLELLEQADAL